MSSSATATDMAVDTTISGGVIKLNLQGIGEEGLIVDFPVTFIKYAKNLENIINDFHEGNVDDLMKKQSESTEPPIQVAERINKNYYDLFIKYCTWMHQNPEIIAKRYKEIEKTIKDSEGNEQKTSHTEFDKEFDITEWEMDLFYELNDQFGTEGYQLTPWERQWFFQMGQQLSETKSDPEKGIKGGKKYKEYLDDPYQSVFASVFYCTEWFECQVLDQASKKFFAQKILPRWTPKELKALGKEKFNAMDFKERYSEYDSNRDKLDFDKIDELDRMALPKRTSKELATLMGREYIKNPHATEDPVEYLNDPLQIYTLECPGPEKCYAKDCENYNGAQPGDGASNEKDDDDEESD